MLSHLTVIIRIQAQNSPYRSGRSPDWIKLKNPNAPAVKREAEEASGEAGGRRGLGKVKGGNRIGV